MKQKPIEKRRFKMTKKTMVEELVKYGCVAKEDTSYLLKRTKDVVENLYKEVLPMRKKFLAETK